MLFCLFVFFVFFGVLGCLVVGWGGGGGGGGSEFWGKCLEFCFWGRGFQLMGFGASSVGPSDFFGVGGSLLEE